MFWKDEPCLEMGLCFSTRRSCDRQWATVFKSWQFQSLSRLWSRTGRASIATRGSEIEQIVCKIWALRGRKGSFTIRQMYVRGFTFCSHSNGDLSKAMLKSLRRFPSFNRCYRWSYILFTILKTLEKNRALPLKNNRGREAVTGNMSALRRLLDGWLR